MSQILLFIFILSRKLKLKNSNLVRKQVREDSGSGSYEKEIEFLYEIYGIK